MQALLMSSSRMQNLGYLEHADEHIHSILQKKPIKVLFIPYAAVSFSFNDYESMVKPVFNRLSYDLESIHHYEDPVAAVKQAEAIAVGGGNTFALLKRLYDNKLVDAIRSRVKNDGIPYLGWSAGTNVATATIRTTNDMPIVEPPSFKALQLVPFQVNPHFISGKPKGHNGESREERLNEFLAINPTEELIALKEGCALFVQDDNAKVLGQEPALYLKQSGQIDSILPNQPFALSSIRGVL